MLTVDTISREVSRLAPKYGIARVDLFGSYANGLAAEHSDVDVMIRFNRGNASIFDVMGFKEELTRRLANPVDVITWPLVNPDAMVIDKTVTLYESG